MTRFEPSQPIPIKYAPKNHFHIIRITVPANSEIRYKIIPAPELEDIPCVHITLEGSSESVYSHLESVSTNEIQVRLINATPRDAKLRLHVSLIQTEIQREE